MSILSRCRDILASNVNALLDKAEDPAKLVDQYLRDAREDLAECKKETAGVMAAEKRAERDLNDLKEKIAKHGNAAKNAVRAGNDDDARKILADKQELEAQLPQLQKNYDSAHASAENMRKMVAKLTDDIQALEARKATVQNTVAVAKAQEAANKFSARADYGAEAVDGIARMEQKANERLDRANAQADLHDMADEDDDLVDKYGAGGSASVEDELAALKAELNGGESNE